MGRRLIHHRMRKSVAFRSYGPVFFVALSDFRSRREVCLLLHDPAWSDEKVSSRSVLYSPECTSGVIL